MKVTFQVMYGAYSQMVWRRVFGTLPAAIPCRSFAEYLTRSKRTPGNLWIIRLKSPPTEIISQNYRIHPDLEGSPDDMHVASALKQMRPQVEALRVLGSYGQARIPW